MFNISLTLNKNDKWVPCHDLPFPDAESMRGSRFILNVKGTLELRKFLAWEYIF